MHHHTWLYYSLSVSCIEFSVETIPLGIRIWGPNQSLKSRIVSVKGKPKTGLRESRTLLSFSWAVLALLSYMVLCHLT
jgi:hypothetical protein